MAKHLKTWDLTEPGKVKKISKFTSKKRLKN